MTGNRGSAQPVLEQWYDAIAVTPSDSTANLFNKLQVTVAGNLKVRTVSGNDVTYTGVTVGMIVPFPVNLVYSTGTTASVVGLPL